jgi:hypothetical protein
MGSRSIPCERQWIASSVCPLLLVSEEPLCLQWLLEETSSCVWSSDYCSLIFAERLVLGWGELLQNLSMLPPSNSFSQSLMPCSNPGFLSGRRKADGCRIPPLKYLLGWFPCGIALWVPLVRGVQWFRIWVRMNQLHLKHWEIGPSAWEESASVDHDPFSYISSIHFHDRHHGAP